MRRMINIAAFVSMVVFLATLALWVRSFWHRDYVMLQHVYWVETNCTHWISYDVHSDSGRLWAFRIQRSIRGGDDEVGWYLIRDSQRPHPPTGFFHCHSVWDLPNESFWRWPFIGVPHAVPAVVFALLPAMSLRSWLRKRRSGPYTCRGCGYDLRATPERCPECGMVVSAIVE